MEFFRQQFDKFMLALLFLVLLGITVHMSLKPAMDEGTLDWARSTGNLIIGALLGLITGRLSKGGTDTGPEANTKTKTVIESETVPKE